MMLELIIDALESILYIMFLNRFCGHKYKGSKLWSSAFLAAMSLFLNIAAADWNSFFFWPTTLLDLIIVIFYGILCLCGSWYIWLMGAVVFNLGLICSVIVSMAIGYLLTENGINSWMKTDTLERFLLLIVGKIILVGYMYGFLKLRRLFIGREKKRTYGGILLIPVITIVLVCLLLQNLVHAYHMNKDTTLLISLLIGIFTLFSVILYLLIYALKREKESREKQLMIELMEIQKHSYQNELEHYEIIRRAGHDMKNQLLGIKYYFDCGDVKEGQRCLEEMVHKLSEEVRISAGFAQMRDSIWGAMLTMKLEKARTCRITVKESIEYLPGNEMNPLDVCALLGNLLDNAIEAEEKNQYHKELIVRIYEEYGNVCLYIANWVENGKLQEAREKVSRKKDKSLHGIGLRSVELTVEKYGGKFQQQLKVNWFQIRILLPIAVRL